MVSASATVPDTIRFIFHFPVDFQGVPKKMRFANEGMIWVDPKKVVFNSFFIIQIVLTYAVQERYEAHYSRSRTYQPSRAGVTHALRVLSSSLHSFNDL